MPEFYPDLAQRTRERAYALWQQEGCPADRASQHWECAQAAELAATERLIDVEEEDSFPASDPPSRSAAIGLR